MGTITRIEDKLGEWVENPFRDPKDLDPLVIETAIKKTARKHLRDLLGRTVIPNDFRVIIDGETYGNFEPFWGEFKKTIQESVEEWIKENGFDSLGPLVIRFEAGWTGGRSIQVEADFNENQGAIAECGWQMAEYKKDNIKNEREYLIELKMHKTEEKIMDTPRGKIIGELVHQGTGERFRVSTEDLFIGRDEGCTIVIPDPMVSRVHAGITVEHGKGVLEDLGSRGGTRVNLEKISRKVLTNGDRISIGEAELVYLGPTFD